MITLVCVSGEHSESETNVITPVYHRSRSHYVHHSHRPMLSHLCLTDLALTMFTTHTDQCYHTCVSQISLSLCSPLTQTNVITPVYHRSRSHYVHHSHRPMLSHLCLTDLALTMFTTHTDQCYHTCVSQISLSLCSPLTETNAITPVYHRSHSHYVHHSQRLIYFHITGNQCLQLSKLYKTMHWDLGNHLELSYFRCPLSEVRTTVLCVEVFL